MRIFVSDVAVAAPPSCGPLGAVAPHQPPYDLRRKLYDGGPNWGAAVPRKRQRRTGSSSPEEPLCLDAHCSELMALEAVLPTSASVGSTSPVGHNEASIEGTHYRLNIVITLTLF